MVITLYTINDGFTLQTQRIRIAFCGSDPRTIQNGGGLRDHHQNYFKTAPTQQPIMSSESSHIVS